MRAIATVQPSGQVRRRAHASTYQCRLRRVLLICCGKVYPRELLRNLPEPLGGVLVLGPARHPGGYGHPREFGKSIGAIVSAADGERAGGGEKRRQATLRNLLPKAGDPFGEAHRQGFALVCAGFAERWPAGLQVGQRGTRMRSIAENAPSVLEAALVQLDRKQ